MFFHSIPILEPWGWASAIISVLVTVILISIFVRIIVRIVRGDRCHFHGRRYGYCGADENQASSARTILDERYAKGEINEEEYRRMKENLK